MNFLPKFLRRDDAANAVATLTEDEMWGLFWTYIAGENFNDVLKEHGPLEGSVGSKLGRYRKLLDYDANHNQLGVAQLRRLVDTCWSMYDYDPLIRQGVDSRALYTFGQGVTIGCRKKGSWGTQLSKWVNDFWFDPCNFRQFTSAASLVSCDIQLQVEGNVALFVWEEEGMMQVRPLKTSWIESLVMSNGSGPGAKKVGYVLDMGYSSLYSGGTEYFQKSSAVRNHRVAYADIDADPEELEGLVGDVPIEYNGRIAHLKAWGRPWSGLGIPMILPALDPAQRYGGFLEDWSVVQGLFRTFALSVISKGTNKGVQDIVKKYRDNSLSGQYNPALNSPDLKSSDTPVAHTLFTGMTSTGNPGTKIEAIKTAGATEGPEKARELKLLLCSAFGLPETMFGDAKVGNHATAHTLERTVDLRAQANQTMWSDFIESLLKYVARQSRFGNFQDESVDIFVSFPPIVEHVISDHVGAIVLAYESGIITDMVASREILQALHISDREEVLRAMYNEDNYGKVREPSDMLKADTDVEKAKIQAQAMRDNAKMMMNRNGGGGGNGSSGSNSNRR